jgi:hypothetical protein
MVRSTRKLSGILFLTVATVSVFGPAAAQTQSRGKDGDSFERQFLRTMIPHH